MTNFYKVFLAVFILVCCNISHAAVSFIGSTENDVGPSQALIPALMQWITCHLSIIPVTTLDIRMQMSGVLVAGFVLVWTGKWIYPWLAVLTGRVFMG